MPRNVKAIIAAGKRTGQISYITRTMTPKTRVVIDDDHPRADGLVHAITASNKDERTKATTGCGRTIFVSYLLPVRRQVNCLFCLGA